MNDNLITVVSMMKRYAKLDSRIDNQKGNQRRRLIQLTHPFITIRQMKQLVARFSCWNLNRILKIFYLWSACLFFVELLSWLPMSSREFHYPQIQPQNRRCILNLNYNDNALLNYHASSNISSANKTGSAGRVVFRAAVNVGGWKKHM